MTTSITVGFAAFCLANGVDPDRMSAVLAEAYSADGERGQGLVASVETGQISGQEFDRRLAEALSVGLPEPLNPLDLSARLFGTLVPEPRMTGMVEAARRGGLKTGLISNTWGVRPPPESHALFDVVVLSGREGIRKPDPEIYLLTAGRLGVPPEACVFVDDIPANVDGAREVGMAALLHRDPAITIRKLETLFDVALS